MPYHRSYAQPEPLSLALDPLDPIEPPRPQRKRRNRTSISSPSSKLSDAEAFKQTYRSPTGNPTFAASMTHLPTTSAALRATSPIPRFSHDVGRRDSSPFSHSRSRDGSDNDNSDRSDTSDSSGSPGSAASQSVGSTPAPYEPLRASSAAHARVQRNLARRAMASTMSLSVAHEVEEKEERNHRVFAGSKVARWVNKFVRR